MDLSMFLTNALLVIWIVSVVVQCDHQKRDVHHKIVIQERRPRSEGHKRGNHHDHRHSYEQIRPHKKGKRHHAHKQNSEENYSSSRENSFEDTFKDFKGHQSQHKNIRPYHYSHVDSKENERKKHKKPTYYPSSISEEENSYKNKYVRQQKDEWKPLFNTEDKLNNYDYFKKRNLGKEQDSKPKDSFKIEFTTNRPKNVPIHSDFDIPLYPPLGNDFIFNQKTSSSNQALLTNYEKFSNVKPNNIKTQRNQNNTIKQNHKTSYEVTEINVEDVTPFTTIKPFLFIDTFNASNNNVFSNFKPLQINISTNTNKKPTVRTRVNRGKRKFF